MASIVHNSIWGGGQPLTEEEKEERRQAALKAAESRTNDWNKKLNKRRQATQTKSATNGVGELGG